MIFLANFKTDTSFQSARTAVITTFTWPRREVVNRFAPVPPNPEEKCPARRPVPPNPEVAECVSVTWHKALNNAPAGSIQCTEGSAASPRSTGAV